MARICATEKTARRREWIEEGLLEMMQLRRFEEISVTQLCGYLNLPRRSFYRYFRDLEDVLDSALTRTFEKMMMPLELPDPEEMAQSYRFWLQNRAVLDALHRSNMLDKLFEYTLRFAEPDRIQGILSLDGEDQDIRREICLFSTTGSVSLAIAWYLDGFRKTPEEMARIAHRLLYKPIFKK